MSYIELLDKMWTYYTNTNPENLRVHDFIMQQGEIITNDHIAIRTIQTEPYNIKQLSTFFTQYGYQFQDEYHFKQKKLRAEYFLHEDEDAPKIFISELKLDECSSFLQQTLTDAFNHIDQNLMQNENVLISGRSWDPIYHTTYKQLYEESEYAAWLYCFGLCPNHFTVNVNNLNQYSDLNKLNTLLTDNGYELNTQGGAIKGTPADFLEQSSTMAAPATVAFNEGAFSIPYCYYEFAKRYPDHSGKLYQGFVPQSADKIFESTDNKK